jgi:hypothetical protein
MLSLLALVVALTGTAVAAGLAANSVGSKQLKKNSVTAKKLKNGAVTTKKIKDGAIQARNIAPGVLPPPVADPITIDHRNVAPGVSLPTVSAAGLEFRPTCVLGGGALTAQVAIQDTSGGFNALQLSGILLTLVGSTRTPTPIQGSGSSSFEPNAASTSGNAATTSFEGVIRSEPGEWLRVSVGLRSNFTLNTCSVLVVITNEG